MFDPREATVYAVRDALFSGEISCREVVSSFLSRIEAYNPAINAVVSLNPNALNTADELDIRLKEGNATGALFAVPVLLKDNFDAVGMKSTGGCRALKDSQPSIDAPSVKALRDAGAIVLGKVNMHELALEGLTVSSLGGQTLNPYDLTRTPGGSSGGTGAAIAASFAVFGTGTDTMNSLRSPASANGLFSIRPTSGLISRAGIMPVSHTQDAIGPIGRSLKDVATALTVMAGTECDVNDDTTSLVPRSVREADYVAAINGGSLIGVRLGLVEGFFNRTAGPETTPVIDAMDAMVFRLKSAGAIVVSIKESFYNSGEIWKSCDVQKFEFREEMDSYLQQEGLQGSHPFTLSELYDSGNFLVIPAQYSFINAALSSSTHDASYADKQRNIQELKLAVQKTFETHELDALIYPQQANLVVKTGSPSQSGRNGIMGAVAGFPVVTVPAGFSAPDKDAPEGVPIGMEIFGLPWTETKLLNIAGRLEELTPVRKVPQLVHGSVAVRKYSEVPHLTPNPEIPLEYVPGVL